MQPPRARSRWLVPSLLAAALQAGCGGGGTEEAASSAAPMPAGSTWRIQLAGGAGETLTGPGGRARFRAGGQTVQLTASPAGGASFRLTDVETGQTGTFPAATFSVQLPDGWECADDPARGDPPSVTLERNDPGRVVGAVEGTIQCASGAEVGLSGTFDVAP